MSVSKGPESCLTIKKGTTFGILGGTGSGKSTLMYLMNRLYDLPEGNGKITFGGVDVADMKAEWVRSNVGMVLQEPFLFSRTIKENIGITLYHLKQNPAYYLERREEGLLIFDLKLNHLTLMVEK